MAINDLNQEHLLKTKEAILKESAVDVYTMSFDVTDWNAMQSFAADIDRDFGQVDLVINNAGAALGAYSAEEVSIDDFKWLMDINFWGMVYGSKAFLPYLKARPKSTLVNISSILGLVAVGLQSPYCASKFAIRGFTESLRMEAMMDFPHVNIMSVHPGGIKTSIAKNSKWNGSYYSGDQIQAMTAEFEKSFINTPEYAANKILSGIKGNKKRVLIGQDARNMWRIVNWFPVSYTKILINTFMKKYDLTHRDQ